MNNEVKALQLKALIHGLIGISIGLYAGIALTFVALGEISFWPFFSIQVDIPGDMSMWRGAHTGPILNGLMCIVLASALSLVNADTESAKRIVYSLIFMVWGNSIFYIARMWGTNRGLALHTEKYGDGTIFDAIAMLPAFIAVFITIYAVNKLFSLARKELNTTETSLPEEK